MPQHLAQGASRPVKVADNVRFHARREARSLLSVGEDLAAHLTPPPPLVE
jgi:hypothetical protein